MHSYLKSIMSVHINVNLCCKIYKFYNVTICMYTYYYYLIKISVLQAFTSGRGRRRGRAPRFVLGGFHGFQGDEAEGNDYEVCVIQVFI